MTASATVEPALSETGPKPCLACGAALRPAAARCWYCGGRQPTPAAIGGGGGGEAGGE